MYDVLKKRYGQNFLIDKNILKKITNLIPKSNLDILEIGPGNGSLTDEIIFKKPAKITIVEIDKDLMPNLDLKYKDLKNINLINLDILNFEIKDKYDLVISNLPYNISSQILVKFTTLEKSPDKMIFMFQKEFSKRLLDTKLNSISSLVKCFYKVTFNFNVGRNCFRPIPKVDSSVITFDKKKDALIDFNEINNFISFKRKLFSHKRKKIGNLLKNYNLGDKFDLNLRVEELDLLDLIKIFRMINF
jgi:16S rRNA (adenine1518-N6/adenine1519-N6)-dimethyltransferase